MLGEVPFLSIGGPGREEMHAMFELLCKNRNPEPGESELELSHAAVSKVFLDAQKTNLKKEARRDAWQKSVAQLMTKGMTRRAHFKLVVSAEVLRSEPPSTGPTDPLAPFSAFRAQCAPLQSIRCTARRHRHRRTARAAQVLRCVGFGARELLGLAFSPEELKAGFFEARELHIDAGFTPAQLKALGYTPKDMWEAEPHARCAGPSAAGAQRTAHATCCAGRATGGRPRSRRPRCARSTTPPASSRTAGTRRSR